MRHSRLILNHDKLAGVGGEGKRFQNCRRVFFAEPEGSVPLKQGSSNAGLPPNRTCFVLFCFRKEKWKEMMKLRNATCFDPSGRNLYLPVPVG